VKVNLDSVFLRYGANSTPEILEIKPSRAWKTLLVGMVFLISLVSFPQAGAAETTLTGTGILKVVNQDRAGSGARPLLANDVLQMAAEAKAADIFANGYFAHTSPGGKQAWDFIKEQGFAYDFAGENLAINYTNSYELEKDFLASPSHRDNLLSPLFTEIGIAVKAGMYEGKPAIVTVQIFASPR